MIEVSVRFSEFRQWLRDNFPDIILEDMPMTSIFKANVSSTTNVQGFDCFRVCAYLRLNYESQPMYYTELVVPIQFVTWRKS